MGISTIQCAVHFISYNSVRNIRPTKLSKIINEAPITIQGGLKQLVIQHKKHNVVVSLTHRNFPIPSDNKLLTITNHAKLLRLHVRAALLRHVHIRAMRDPLQSESPHAIVYIIDGFVFDLWFWCGHLLF